MRLLGIDYGSKNIGLAITDEGGQMAFPHAVYANDTDFMEKLLALIETKEVEAIVIGHSLNSDGKENAVQADINELVTDLTLHTGIPVHLEPEQYTTQEAMRLQGDNELIDAAAATIILNSYLQKKHD